MTTQTVEISAATEVWRSHFVTPRSPTTWIESYLSHGLSDVTQVTAHETVTNFLNILDRRPQVKMLPTPDDVASVVARLDVEDLRQFTAAIMNCAVASARAGVLDLDSVRLLNSWFGSMEETLAAGKSIDEVLDRRNDREGYQAI